MEQEQNETLPISVDELLSTMAHLAAGEGYPLEVAILASADQVSILLDQNAWIGVGHDLHIQVPIWIYTQMNDYCKINYDDEGFVRPEIRLKTYARIVLMPYPDYDISNVKISPSLTSDKDWREKAWDWLTGEKLNNQGRVRSDNIASRTSDGLLFRSDQEILLYKELKSRGVSFAPLPVFIRGGKEYRRIEPDFVILKDGIVLVVEVDGDTFHRETPAEAHSRTTMLVHEGAHVERIRASDCDTPEKAKVVALKLIRVIEQLKKSGK